MDTGKIAQLKAFVNLCESTPSVLQDRNYLEKLNAKLPPSAYGKSETSKGHKEESDDEMPEFNEKPRGTANQEESAGVFESDTSDIEESDIELDTSEVVEPDDEPPQPMGDASIDVTEEMRDNAQIAKGKANEAIEEGDLETAIQCFTEAILGNPSSSILYANRAGVYMKMKKPNAAIRDADAAIKINPESARGYKSRGQAHALLGHWAEAAKDLHIASKLDYDEEIASILKKVEPNSHKIEEHERKYQRLRKEQEARKAARSKARQQQSEAKEEEQDLETEEAEEEEAVEEESDEEREEDAEGEKAEAMDKEERANGGEEEEESEERKRRKERRRKKLLREMAKSERRGVCYLSRIPPHLKPLKLRHLLSQYGEVLRIYLAPEDSGVRLRRKMAGKDSGKNFTEGWVEFADKTVARRVAEMLNGELMGGKRRSAYFYDLWNIKYLKKFKWDNLTEEIAYRNAVREQKQAANISAAKRERDFYLSKVDQSKAIAAMEERKNKRSKTDKLSEVAASAQDADETRIVKTSKIVRHFPQKKSVLADQNNTAARLSRAILSAVLGRSST